MVLILLWAAGFSESKEAFWLVSNRDLIGGPIVNEPTEPGTRSIPIKVIQGDGPLVEIVEPSTQEVASPFPIRIKFEPRGAAIDIESVRLVVRRRMLGIPTAWDITKRVRGKITGQGLVVPNAAMPRGKYEIEMRLRDVLGNESAGMIELRVTR